MRRAWRACQAVWRLLCDMSGETALARRSAACACAKDPIKAAWQETYGGIHRCC